MSTVAQWEFITDRGRRQAREGVHAFDARSPFERSPKQCVTERSPVTKATTRSGRRLRD